jgi:NADH dehydrogenase/NADH:ubiquinone oxidoreductase subunit G
MDAQRNDVEGWKSNPWTKLPTWAKWTIGVVGAFILLGIGAAIGSSEEDDIQTELEEAQAALVAAEQDRDEAEATADDILARRDQILMSAKSQASELTAKLDSLQSQVDTAKGELAETESSLAGAEEEVALSSISDGIWKAEADYIPGTYRAPGGDGCYWATLNSADPYDIASNENGTGPQVATIESPYFQTKGCGTWERIE